MVSWIILLFAISLTDGCLKVGNLYDIPEGCNCSLPIAIDAEGILEMSEASQFLKDRFTVKPNGFYMVKDTQGNCVIRANAAKMPSSYDTFDFMLFTKNGRPVMPRRFRKADDVDRNEEFDISGLRCLNREGFWTYYAFHNNKDDRATNLHSPMEGLALALQADQESCNCKPPTASAKFGVMPTVTIDSCNVFRVDCGGNNPGLYVLSSSANRFRIDNIRILDLFTCIKDGSEHVWYYNDIRLESLEFTCKADAAATSEFGCITPHRSPDELSKFDLTGEFSYYEQGGYYEGGLSLITSNEFFTELACSEVAVTFENNNSMPGVYVDKLLAPHCVGTNNHTTPDFTNPVTYFNNAPVSDLAFFCVNTSKLKPLVMEAGFSCSLPKAISKEDIDEMQDGIIYKELETYAPVFKLFEVKNELDGTDFGNTTVIEAACTGRSKETLGYLMIFRTNGSPITAARYYGKGFKKFIVQGLLCPKDGTKNWLYYGGVLENPIFACQEDFVCGCPTIVYSDKLGLLPEGRVSEKCLPSEVTCSSGSLYILSQFRFPIKVTSSDLNDLICLNHHWQYHDVHLVKLEFTCDTSDTSGLAECPAYQLLNNAADLETYDKKGFFSDKTPIFEIEIGKSQVVYANPKVSQTQFICESGIVVFPEPGTPWTNETGVLNLFCGSSVGYFIDATPALSVRIACYDENTDRISMGKCKCPPVWHIDQERVKSTKNSEYLGERETVRPKVKFGEECQMDISWETPPADDFYFMVFRENGPPIFNKRFINSGEGANHFSADGVQCVKVDDEYEWQYYGGKLTNISFAFQTNTDKCKCNAWQGDDSVKSIAAVDGKCDNYRVTCNSFTHLGYISGGEINGQIILPRRTDNLIEELTCAKVGGEHFWYYGGIKTSQATASCGPATFAGEAFNASWSCSCPHFFVLLPSNNYISVYNKDGSLDNVELMQASVEYELSITCKPTFTCQEPSKMAFFSTNNEPLKYENDASPSVQCHMTQLGGDVSVSSSYWYVDGILLVEPAFGCIFEIDDYVPP